MSNIVHFMRFNKTKYKKGKLVTILRTSLLSLAGISCAAAASAVHAHASDQQNPVNISIYTHGDTQFARFDSSGNVTGEAQEWLNCAASKLGFTYDFKFAPLSRANSLRQSADHMMWFPSSGTQERIRVGPVGTMDIIWYQMKTDDTDVTSQAFMQNAKVTAYAGSSFETMLQNQGYKFIKGSADHNRLIYMLLSGSVDALLSVDFRFKLSADVREKMEEQVRTTVYRHVPVFFNLSEHMANDHPELTKALQSHNMDCTE